MHAPNLEASIHPFPSARHPPILQVKVPTRQQGSLRSEDCTASP